VTPSSRPRRSAIIGCCAGWGSPLIYGELRQFGGAIARKPENPGALGAIEDPYCLFALGLAMDPESGRVAAEHATKVCETMEPWAGEREYFNFAENPGDSSTYYDADSHARLRQIRAQVDPGGIFQANHAMEAA
jgi:hypothetical protein